MVSLLSSTLAGLTVTSLGYIVYELYIKKSHKDNQLNRKPSRHMLWAIGVLVVVLLLDIVVSVVFYKSTGKTSTPATPVAFPKTESQPNIDNPHTPALANPQQNIPPVSSQLSSRKETGHDLQVRSEQNPVPTVIPTLKPPKPNQPTIILEIDQNYCSGFKGFNQTTILREIEADLKTNNFLLNSDVKVCLAAGYKPVAPGSDDGTSIHAYAVFVLGDPQSTSPCHIATLPCSNPRLVTGQQPLIGNMETAMKKIAISISDLIRHPGRRKGEL
jgi:hypothetical protein